jgi:hypothetical protein
MLQGTDACDRRGDRGAARRDPGAISSAGDAPAQICVPGMQHGIVQAPTPERLIKGGLPTEAMVAHVLASKYAWHLPLYRQAQMLKSQGIVVERMTLASWAKEPKFGTGEQGNKPRQKVVSMYVNVMETRVQKEVRDLSRVLAHVLTDCLRGGIPSRLLAATIVPRGHAPRPAVEPISTLFMNQIAVLPARTPLGPLGILVIARLGPRGLGSQGGNMCLRFLPRIVCHRRDLTGR